MFDNEVLHHVNGKETLSSDAVIQQLVSPKNLENRSSSNCMAPGEPAAKVCGSIAVNVVYAQK